MSTLLEETLRGLRLGTNAKSITFATLRAELSCNRLFFPVVNNNRSKKQAKARGMQRYNYPAGIIFLTRIMTRTDPFPPTDSFCVFPHHFLKVLGMTYCSGT